MCRCSTGRMISALSDSSKLSWKERMNCSSWISVDWGLTFMTRPHHCGSVSVGRCSSGIRSMKNSNSLAAAPLQAACSSASAGRSTLICSWACLQRAVKGLRTVMTLSWKFSVVSSGRAILYMARINWVCDTLTGFCARSSLLSSRREPMAGGGMRGFWLASATRLKATCSWLTRPPVASWSSSRSLLNPSTTFIAWAVGAGGGAFAAAAAPPACCIAAIAAADAFSSSSAAAAAAAGSLFSSMCF
mmetsp:Transcript_38997/g.92079  ORF Transcript_38997/g.92079 Transcript_38997/m.92079 type:complete len:246 (+) Transcript_38997:597-1334(+)